MMLKLFKKLGLDSVESIYGTLKASEVLLLNDALRVITDPDNRLVHKITMDVLPKSVKSPSHRIVEDIFFNWAWVNEQMKREWPCLDKAAIAMACVDFVISRLYMSDYAETLEERVLLDFQKDKAAKWYQTSFVEREPRQITMELYPLYFKLILEGSKRIEGRAYKPDSSKQYTDILPGDEILFNINRERPDWISECQNLGLNPAYKMAATVGSVHFAPLVQALFHQLDPSAGEDFQPERSYGWDLVSTAIHNATRYYSIPEYPRLISKNGFIGLSLIEPHLI